MSVFEDIKNSLRQAIAFEKEKRVIRSHLEQAKYDVQQGKVQPSETVAAEIINDLENGESLCFLKGGQSNGERT